MCGRSGEKLKTSDWRQKEKEKRNEMQKQTCIHTFEDVFIYQKKKFPEVMNLKIENKALFGDNKIKIEFSIWWDSNFENAQNHSFAKW